MFIKTLQKRPLRCTCTCGFRFGNLNETRIYSLLTRNANGRSLIGNASDPMTGIADSHGVKHMDKNYENLYSCYTLRFCALAFPLRITHMFIYCFPDLVGVSGLQCDDSGGSKRNWGCSS